MTCLLGFIGVSSVCGTPSSQSGLFIDNLPGITLESIEKVSEPEKPTYTSVFENIENRTLQKFGTIVTNYYSKQYRLRRVLDNIDLGKKINTIDNQTPAANELRGILISLDYPDYHSGSILRITNLQTLSFYAKNNISGLPFKVIDANTSEVLETFTKDVTTGWNLIAENKNYRANKIFIGYDASSLESAYMPIHQHVNGWCSCVSDAFNCDSKIEGAKTENPFTEITEKENNTFGLSANIGILCGYDGIVCNNKAVFATALWYMMGAEMLTERIYSDRLNKYTTISRDRAKELRDEFEVIWKNELATALDGIQISSYDCCIECDAQLTYAESIM